MEKRTYYLNRKLSCGDVLDYAAEFFRLHLKDLIVMTLFFHLPVMIVTHYLSSASLLSNMMMAAFTEYQYEAETLLPLLYIMLVYVGTLLSAVYSVTLYQVLQIGAIKYTYEGIVNEERIRPKKALGFGFRKFGWMIVYALLAGVVVYVVYMLFAVVFFVGIFMLDFVAPSALDVAGISFLIVVLLLILALLCVFIYFAVRLSFVPHAIAVDGCNTFSAIGRSFRLTKKRFWRTALPLLFGSVLLSMGQSAISGAFSVLVLTGESAFRIAEGVIGGLSAFLAPITFVIGTVMFAHYKTQDGDVAFEQKMQAEREMLERKQMQQQELLAGPEESGQSAETPAAEAGV